MSSSQITLQLIPADSDAEELDRHTRRLRDELRELNVESVDLVQGTDAPAGTKSGAEFMLGTMTIKMLADQLPKLLPQIVELALKRVAPSSDDKVKIKINDGKKSVEVEFSARATSSDDVEKLTSKLLKELKK